MSRGLGDVYKRQVKDDDIVTDIMNLDISNMTPIDALNTLYKLQGKAKNRW